MTNSDLQKQIFKWFLKNFKNKDGVEQTNNYLIKCQLIGMIEELGELSHAILKIDQDIRNEEDHIEQLKDAIGDFMIFCYNFMSINNFDIQDIFDFHWRKETINLYVEDSSFECLFNIQSCLTEIIDSFLTESIDHELDIKENIFNIMLILEQIALSYIPDFISQNCSGVFEIIENIANEVLKRDWTR